MIGAASFSTLWLSRLAGNIYKQLNQYFCRCYISACWLEGCSSLWGVGWHRITLCNVQLQKTITATTPIYHTHPSTAQHFIHITFNTAKEIYVEIFGFINEYFFFFFWLTFFLSLYLGETWYGGSGCLAVKISTTEEHLFFILLTFFVCNYSISFLNNIFVM